MTRERVAMGGVNIEEVRTVDNQEEANELLVSGWLLLSSGTRHIDDAGYQAKVYFILGFPRKG